MEEPGSSTNSIFQLYESLTEERLLEMVDRREPEGSHLEFKRWDDQSSPAALSKALSGFANSDGGILIFGIEGKKNEDGIDCACSLHLVKQAKQVERRIGDSLVNSTEPPVPDVRHRAIVREDGTGFVVVLVPASDGGPYMAAVGKDQNRWFRRNAHGQQVMGYSAVADMFGRSPRCLLQLQVARLTCQTGFCQPRDKATYSRIDVQISVTLIVHNAGRGLAKFPSVTLKESTFELPFGATAGASCPFRHQPTVPTKLGEIVLITGVHDVIHSGSSLPLHSLIRTIHFDQMRDRLGTRAPISDVVIGYSLAAEGMARREGTLTVNRSDIVAEISKLQLSGFPLSAHLEI